MAEYLFSVALCRSQALTWCREAQSCIATEPRASVHTQTGTLFAHNTRRSSVHWERQGYTFGLWGFFTFYANITILMAETAAFYTFLFHADGTTISILWRPPDSMPNLQHGLSNPSAARLCICQACSPWAGLYLGRAQNKLWVTAGKQVFHS